jgi:hypothetical protein
MRLVGLPLIRRWFTNMATPVQAGHGSDRGSAMLMAVVATAAAAGISLIAVTAITRSITNEDRMRRQHEVDQLAVSAAEEAFGRIARDREGLYEITGLTTEAAEPDNESNGEPVNEPAVIIGHLGYGTDPDIDTGPWVRFDEIGQVIPCGEDARLACYTIRLAAAPDVALATSAVIDVTARQCKNADPEVSTCVRSRIQTTLRARAFVDHVIWVDNDNRIGTDTDQITGPVRIGEDSLALPTPIASDLEGIAGLRLDASTISIGAETGAEITVTDSAGMRTEAVPVNGVIFIEGDLVIEQISAITSLTIAATGTVTISGDVQSTEPVTIISLNGDIQITTTDLEQRQITAVLLATSTGSGTVRAVVDDTIGEAPEELPTLALNGAVIARTLGPFTFTDTIGYRLNWAFEDSLRRVQSPFGIYQVRGRWIRVDQVAVFPGG